MEDVALGLEVPEKQKRPLSGEVSPARSRPGWGEDSSGPDEVLEEMDPRDAVGAGQLLLTYAGLPESVPPAPTSSPTTEPLLLPTPPPTQAPLPGEVAARETPAQCNDNRMLRVVTNCLNRVHPQAPATLIDSEAAKFTRLYLKLPPSRIIDVSAGTLDRPSAWSLMRMKELQDIIAPFGVHTAVESFDMKGKLGAAIIWMARVQYPSLSVARDIYTALLVEAERPESLPKFALQYGQKIPAPAPCPLPDPTVQ
jgi:hypothetical protein